MQATHTPITTNMITTLIDKPATNPEIQQNHRIVTCITNFFMANPEMIKMILVLML